MFLCPHRNVRAAAFQDRDVERIDAHLLEHRRATGAGEGVVVGGPGFWRGWVGLELKPLERPCAAALDLRWHARQRDQRAELSAAALELERRHVMLDAVVVRRERGGTAEVHRAVRAD